ncbi:hypothetical protein SK128_016471 [Halocaridina rubra]|uniref:Uncharacterized protein n=1 Tax=Halocaridina rubra TaxID=373956 RepID=A0AAN8WTQ4_HALRR
MYSISLKVTQIPRFISARGVQRCISRPAWWGLACRPPWGTPTGSGDTFFPDQEFGGQGMREVEEEIISDLLNRIQLPQEHSSGDAVLGGEAVIGEVELACLLSEALLDLFFLLTKGSRDAVLGGGAVIGEVELACLLAEAILDLCFLLTNVHPSSGDQIFCREQGRQMEA